MSCLYEALSLFSPDSTNRVDGPVVLLGLLSREAILGEEQTVQNRTGYVLGGLR